MELSYEAFKEPRGFLKILQWIFAICAFATTVNFTAVPSVDIKCTITPVTPTTPVTTTTPVPPTTPVPTLRVSHMISYPFALDHDEMTEKIKRCNFIGNETSDLECRLIGNAKSDSQFFVTTGVLSFLYTTVMIAVYILAEKSYTESNKAPVIDFCFTLVFAVFWLSGSSAWANGLSAVRTGSDPINWLVLINEKATTLCNTAKTGYECSNIILAGFGGIVISILFGFICFILWAANLWFLYKETSWFGGIMQNTSNPGTGRV